MDQTIVKPKVSVVMSFYNCELYILDAIQSILNQTFGDFELICIDDASTDRSAIILESIKDPRIIIIYNDKNMGVAKSVNRGVAIAQGELIARMDADDISFTDRLEKQVKFLIKNPKVVATGGQCIIIDEVNNIIGNKNFPTQSSKLKDMIFWAIPMQQPSMMVNLSKLPKEKSAVGHFR